MEIKIDIENNRAFASVAFVLDQKQLLDKIAEIRLYWELRNALIPYDKFDDWYSQHKDDFALTPAVATYWGEIPDFSFTNTAPAPTQDIIKKIIDSNHIELELEHLLRTNGLKASFRELLLKAIVCGEVKIDDWDRTNSHKTFPNHDSFFNIPVYEKLYKGDTKTEIHRDREWYWEKKKGKTELQIAKDTNHKPEHIDATDFRQNVKNGILRYELFLKNQGTFKRPH